MMANKSKSKSRPNPKSIEVSVAQGEERYHLLVESVKEYAMMLLDPQGRVIEWNSGGTHLLGYTPEEAIGKNFSQFFTREDRKLGKPKIELQTALEKGRADDENWLVRKDKSRFWASGLSMPLRDSANNLLGFAKIVRDLTDRKELDQDREDFISLASHELRTPLTAIKGYIQLLQKHVTQSEDKKATSYLAKLEAQVLRQETLIRDLLDVAKLQATATSFEGTVIEIDVCVKDIVEEQQAVTPTHKFVIEGKSGKKIVGDGHQIRQVMLNLLTNAVKYSPNGKKVIVHLAATDKDAIVSVQDFGVGVPKKYQKRIFDRYVRAENVTKRDIAGYGLGLYIAAGIVKRHHGHIAVKSAAGKGATFTVSIPFVDES
jgi:PAS domain S-box-containing protein